MRTAVRRFVSFRQTVSTLSLLRILCLGLGFALGGWQGASACPTRAGAIQAPSCYGPQVLVRGGSSVDVTVDTFETPTPGAPYLVRVRNGDRHRQQRIGDVWIEVDGEPLFCGDDVTAQDVLVERVFHSDRRLHDLRVVLSGTHPGFITLDVRPCVVPAPVANAGASRSVAVGEQVELTAASTRLPAGLGGSYQWQFVALPSGSTAQLSDPQSSACHFVADVAGVYQVRLLVTSGGLTATSSTQISALGPGNLPPIPDAGPNVLMEVGDSVQLDGSGSFDPEGQPLSYTWRLGAGPPGHDAQLTGLNNVVATFTPDLPGMYVISLSVNDGVLESVQPDRTRMTVSAFNAAPIADAGPDQSVQVGDSVQLDGANSFDPEGQPLGYFWSFVSVPPGSNAGLANASSATPTFVADVAGGYTVQLIVSDGLKFSTPDEVVITAASGQVNVPNVVGLGQSAAGDLIRANGLSVGVVTAVQSASVPAGRVAAQLPVAGTPAALGAPVDLDVSIGGGVDIEPPQVSVSATPGIVNVGEVVALQITATDNVGVTALVLEVDDVPVPLSGGASAPFVPSAPGLYLARATATDAAGLATSATTTFRARAAADNGPPTVAISSPIEDATLRSAVSVTGTASDTDLALYELQIAPAGSGQFVTFATGITSVVSRQLGRLTPGAFAPGVYDLRVCASDTWGNSACSASVRVELEAVKRAPGFLSIGFLDGFVDAVGLPISVRRVYDGANKTVGDFGVGWRLATDEISLSITRPMGADWQIQKVGTIFATYFLNPSKDHRVNVYLPDGATHRFRMRPDPAAQQINPFQFLNGAFFDRLPGTTSTLTPNDQPCFVDPVINFSGPVEIRDCSFNLYNPTSYTLDLLDGRRLVFEQVGASLKFRLSQARDANGNTLTFGPGGLTHSAGAGISWTRDGQGRITSLTNPEGNTRHYTYDARGDLIEATDFAGAVTRFVYDDAHNLIRVIDPRGYTPGTLIYNESEQIVAMIDSNGARVEITYDANTNQQVVTDRLGHTTVNTFDAAGNLVARTNALGETSTFTYDADGNMLTQTDPLGATQTMTYDAEGRLLSHTDPRGNTEFRTYDAAGRLVATTDRMGRVTTLTLDSNGNVTRVTEPNGAATDLTYNSSGALISTTDALGNVTTLTRNLLGQVTRQTDPLGRTVDLQPRFDGQLTSSSFQFGGQTVTYANDYDVNAQLVRATMPDGTFGTASYDAAGLVNSTMDVLGGTQSVVFDAEARPVTFTNRDGGTSGLDYDAEARVVAAELPGAQHVERSLDALGRPTSVVMNGGAALTVQYDAAGRVISQQSSCCSGPVTATYDIGGFLTSQTDGLGNATQFTYDANGSLLTATRPSGAVMRHDYDVVGQRIRTTFEDGSQAHFEYDPIGQLTAVQDALGQRIEFDFDAAGQLVAVTDPAGGIATYTYGELGELTGAATPTGRTWSFASNSKGQRTSLTFPWGAQQTRILDAFGRIVRLTNPDGRFADYSYDAAGNVASTTYSSGATEQMAYDARQQLVSYSDAGGVTSLSYLPSSSLRRVDYPNGDFVEYAYDSEERLASIATPGGVTNYVWDLANRLIWVDDSTIGSTHYVYDVDGRISSIQHADGSVTTLTRSLIGKVVQLQTLAPGGAVLRSVQCTYDLVGRLTSMSEPGRSVSYQYDAAGRLQSETRTGADAGAASYAFDADWNLVQNGSRTLGYDSGMRMLSDGVFSYVHDSTGRPVSRSNASVSEQFSYDPVGRLIGVVRSGGAPSVVTLEYGHDGLLRRLTADGVGRTFLWNNEREIATLLEERADNGALVRRYVHGAGLAGVFDGAAHVLHVDPLGAVRMVTSAAGVVQADLAYSAFGESTLGAASTLSSLRWNGELFLPELGFYFLRSRFYDPVAGRFLTPDLLEPQVGSTLTLAPYQYGDADPVNNSDPLGDFTLVQAQVVSAMIGVLASVALSYLPRDRVFSALLGTAGQLATPLGVEASVSASKRVRGPLKISGGAKVKFVLGTAASMVTVGLDGGGGLDARSPKSLVSRDPGVSVGAGVVFGARSEDSDLNFPPSFGFSLKVTGNIASWAQNVVLLPVPVGRRMFLPFIETYRKTASYASKKLLSPYTGEHQAELFSVGSSFSRGRSLGAAFGAVFTAKKGKFKLRGWLGDESRGPETTVSMGVAISVSVPIYSYLHSGENSSHCLGPRGFSSCD